MLYYLVCSEPAIKIEFCAHTVRGEKPNFTAKQWLMVNTLIFILLISFSGLEHVYLYNGRTKGFSIRNNELLSDCSVWAGDAFWEVVDTMPRVSRFSSPGCALHKVFIFVCLYAVVSFFPMGIFWKVKCMGWLMFPITLSFCLTCTFVNSRDCPIFYRRKKAQKDMAEAKLQLERWNF